MPSFKAHLPPSLKDGRRAQSGATLIELLVSLLIASMALALAVGTFSTGLLNATLAKRNTAVQAVMQYELEAISASAFNPTAPSFSDCFATESPSQPARAAGYQAPCSSDTFTLRADASWQWLPSSSSVQVWTIAVSAWPSGVSVGASVQVYKTSH